MARKNILSHEIALGQSLAASFQSDPTVVQYLDNISYQINILTTNSEGTFSLQGSNDYEVDAVTGALVNAGNWVDLPLGTSVPTVASANDQILIYINQIPFYAVRMAYTSTTAGTGTADIIINCRQMGG